MDTQAQHNSKSLTRKYATEKSFDNKLLRSVNKWTIFVCICSTTNMNNDFTCNFDRSYWKLMKNNHFSFRPFNLNYLKSSSTYCATITLKIHLTHIEWQIQNDQFFFKHIKSILKQTSNAHCDNDHKENLPKFYWKSTHSVRFWFWWTI